MTVKNPQANALSDQMHQADYIMLVTKDLDKSVFEYMGKWG